MAAVIEAQEGYNKYHHSWSNIFGQGCAQLSDQDNGYEIFYAIVPRMNSILRYKKNFCENLFQ